MHLTIGFDLFRFDPSKDAVQFAELNFRNLGGYGITFQTFERRLPTLAAIRHRATFTIGYRRGTNRDGA